MLIKNGVKAVAEGANMPTTIPATDAFGGKCPVAPGKAKECRRRGQHPAWKCHRTLSVSGWKREVVDERLHHIMLDIHNACVEYGSEEKQTNYVQGANIAGFGEVADAMLAQGVL